MYPPRTKRSIGTAMRALNDSHRVVRLYISPGPTELLAAAARVVWITDWFEHNPPANPNVVQAWAKLLRNVPDCEIKIRAIADIGQRLKELPASFREPWRELLKSFPLGESKAQSRTETPQGTGIRDQGSEKQASASTGNFWRRLE